MVASPALPGLEHLLAAVPGRDDVVRRVWELIATVPDEQVVRINPVRFAGSHGLSVADVIDVFLHARKLGLMTLEWQYVCPGCGENLIALKIGVHRGACLAVTLNDRLDYFGQTVNIAARVQALAGAGEIVVTDDVLSQPGAAGLVARLDAEPDRVELRGVAGPMGLLRLRAGPG